jgi:hypothetical protein
VDEFGPNCRREGPEATLEPRLHLIEVHDVEANPSSRRRRRGAGPRVTVIRSAPWLRRSPASRCDRIAELAQTLDGRDCPRLTVGQKNWLERDGGLYSLVRLVSALNPKDPMLGRM